MPRSNALRDLAWPALFLFCLGYMFWYFPRFIVTFGWAEGAVSQNPPAGPLEYLMLAGMFATLAIGSWTAQPSTGEVDIATPLDRVSLFLGRTTMLLVVSLVLVMFYEVVLRYVFESPTLWANELSLWMAGFVFLLAGLYAMQQRSHIRIYLLYDMMPRWLQRACDSFSTLLIVIFAAAMIWGGYNEAHDKFLRWETFGTAFDPPIPATLKPMVLLIIVLVALQAIANLFADWSREAEHHAIVDTDEIEDIVQSVKKDRRDV
jgi:TRAP-type C4-dicarboxylate transport system permease small subunit